MLRFELRAEGGEELPAIDLDDPVVVIGSGPDAKIRVPAGVGSLRVVAAEVGEGTTYELGRYRVRVTQAPAGAVVASVQRTESLARELVRSLLGTGAAPSLEVETGRRAGARRLLAPPESRLVIGRGDEAGWIVDDEELSRAHAEVRRGWDGAWLRDLGSKNGTELDGVRVGADPALIRDGARIELGQLRLRYHDPAERHLHGAPATSATAPTREPARVQAFAPQRSALVFYVAVALAIAAAAAAIWVLAA
jgi:hypothetical protein